MAQLVALGNKRTGSGATGIPAHLVVDVAGSVVDELVLVVYEAIANVVEHTYSDRPPDRDRWDSTLAVLAPMP